MPQFSHIINVDVPDDFPLAPLEQFHGAVHSYWESNNEEWARWAGACNALHYRFLACADADEAFRSSMEAAGPSPPPADRLRQELAVFAFFSSGLSALECLGYGLYFVGAIVEPTAFALAPDQIWFRHVAGAFQAQFPSDRLTHELGVVNKSVDLSESKSVRNILMHREAPGRHHFASIGDRLALGTSTPSSETVQGADWLDRPLSSATTYDRRVWLATALTAMLEAANDFAAARL